MSQRDKPPDFHLAVTEVLQLLSSGDRQLAYERNVPQARITTELYCMWFEDLYFPEEPSFRNCFSQEELSAMAAFSEYYDKQEKLLPQPRNGVSDWLETDAWQGIMREAGRALSVVRADAPLP